MYSVYAIKSETKNYIYIGLTNNLLRRLKEHNKVYRCDQQPCDGYDVSEDVSGLYTNLNPITPSGSLVKLSEDNKYVETVSLGLDFIIYRGGCINK